MTTLFKTYRIIAIVMLLSTIPWNNLFAQNSVRIMGNIQDGADENFLSYATVGLILRTDSSLVSATISDENGDFMIEAVPGSDYQLQISYVGYETITQSLKADGKDDLILGSIYLQKETVNLEEAVVVGERLKAKTLANSTVFYMNEKTYAVSNTGSDILQHIPGVNIG
jgi:iron complex outermembrane recepter protein